MSDALLTLLLEDSEWNSLGIPAAINASAISITEPFQDELGSAIAAVTLLTRQRALHA